MTVIATMPNGKDGEKVVPVILPHQLVQYLVSECHLPISNCRICQYWSHLEAVQDALALSTRGFRQAAGLPVVPLGIYGDEAQIGLQNNPLNQVLGMSLNFPLWRPKSTRLARFTMFSVDSEEVASFPKTIFPILRCITESLNSLSSTGLHGRRYLLTEIRGDQVFVRKLFNHRSWWVAKKICFRCKACTDIPELDYTMCYTVADQTSDQDVSWPFETLNQNIGWPSTHRTTAQFIANEIPPGDECCSSS